MREGAERNLIREEGIFKTKAVQDRGGVLVSKDLKDQSQGFRCKKRGRDDSRPNWWKDQCGMIGKIKGKKGNRSKEDWKEKMLVRSRW